MTHTGEVNQAVQTYRYLRLLTFVPAVWLLLSVGAVAVFRGEVLPSISDYYGGPLRDVFVGTLMASGVVMVAYQGQSKLEDYALNFAGVNACIVALVPNSFADLLATARMAEASGLPVLESSADLLQNLRIAVGILVVVVALFIVLDATVMHWTEFRWSDQTTMGNALVVISWAGELILLGIVLMMLFGLEIIATVSIFSVIHFVAATLLVINLSFAAASHSWPRGLRTKLDAPAEGAVVMRRFRAITFAMWSGIVAGAMLIGLRVPFAILIVEIWEIVLFLLFWAGATRAGWDRWRRLPRPSDASSSAAEPS